MAKKKMDIAKKKALTPTFRVSYPHLFEAHAFKDAEAKFSLTMLFPKDTDLAPLKKAVHNAIIEKYGSDKADWPEELRMPFRNGDKKKDQEGYEGHIFVRATSKKKPGVIDQKKEKIEDEETLYAGCYARATLIAFCYENSGNIGVSFALQNVQKVKDGKPFSGRKAAEDEFDEVEMESDDASNFSNDESEEADESDMGF